MLIKCQGHHHTGNDQLTPIKTSSSVVEVVKLMAWRQATSPLKIPSWSGGKMSSSYIFYNWHPPDQEGNFKGEVACLQGINLTTSNTEDDVFMDGTWLLPVQWCPWHLVNTWNTLLLIRKFWIIIGKIVWCYLAGKRIVNHNWKEVNHIWQKWLVHGSLWFTS